MSAPVNVYALWDEVIISVYYLGAGFGITATTPGQSQGTIVAIGPNVDRVSVGQLVVFTRGATFGTTAGTGWSVVPQSACLVVYKPIIVP